MLSVYPVPTRWHTVSIPSTLYVGMRSVYQVPYKLAYCQCTRYTTSWRTVSVPSALQIGVLSVYPVPYKLAYCQCTRYTTSWRTVSVPGTLQAGVLSVYPVPYKLAYCHCTQYPDLRHSVNQASLFLKIAFRLPSIFRSHVCLNPSFLCQI